MEHNSESTFEGLGPSAQSGLKQLYFIECLERTGKKLDPSLSQLKKGIRVFVQASTSIIPELDKQDIEKRAKGHRCRQ